MVRALPSNVEGEGLISGSGANIKKKKKNPEHKQQKQYCNKFNKGFTNGPHQKKDLKKKNKAQSREFPGGPVLRVPHFHCLGPGLIPGQGTKILQALGV